MKDKTLVISSLLVAALMLSMTVAPSMAFIYPDGSQDNYFENYGPRMDQILVKKYASLQSEIDALKAGEIDFTDWALEKAMIDDLSTDPNIAIVGYGGEVGYYTMNYNNNPNQYLGNPPNSLYPNPKYGNNPTEVKEFRQACSYLLDRPAICTGPGQGMYEPIFTPIPAYMTYWIHPDISYTGSLSALAYPPSVTDAEAALDAGGFHLNGAVRYWDKNDNNVYDGASEDFVIDLYSRADAARRGAADMLEAGFGTLGVQFTDTPGGGGVAWQKCMVEKDYHMYTSGWIYIGPDPDYLFDLYHWDNYYHPEDPPNFGAISQYLPDLQTALEGIKFAPDAATAQSYAYTAQEIFAENACETPICATSSPKAYNKWYTGGNDGVIVGNAEDKYRGQSWEQVVNMMGQGSNNAWTFLNAYPGTYEYGDGNMIARYGWKDNTMPQTLNPMYSSWYWESEIWNKCYDGLGSRDPYTLGPVEVPGIAENWTLGTWVDPDTSETLTKVTLKIRSDYIWADEVPVTMDDVIYTFIGMPAELRAKGCPDVWWQPTLDRIVGFFRLDAYTVEVFVGCEHILGR
jgi:ABC-type oligopeptide transport system substrate-binding subunit